MFALTTNIFRPQVRENATLSKQIIIASLQWVLDTNSTLALEAFCLLFLKNGFSLERCITYMDVEPEEGYKNLKELEQKVKAK